MKTSKLEYTQLENTLSTNVPSADESGGLNLYAVNGVITSKDNSGTVSPVGGGEMEFIDTDNTYATTTAMIAGQSGQSFGQIYQAGTSFYKYLGTTDGDIDDYVIIGGSSGGGGTATKIATWSTTGTKTLTGLTIGSLVIMTGSNNTAGYWIMVIDSGTDDLLGNTVTLKYGDATYDSSITIVPTSTTIQVTLAQGASPLAPINVYEYN